MLLYKRNHLKQTEPLWIETPTRYEVYKKLFLARNHLSRSPGTKSTTHKVTQLP